MLIDVRVPTLAESVPDATLLAWKFRAGDRVERGDVLIELETDKVVLEVPAPQSGMLAEIVMEEGETGESGQLIARIETGDGAAARVGGTAGASRPQDGGAGAGGGSGREGGSAGPGSAAEPMMGPAVRRLVAEHGIDPAAVAATGKDGRLTKADVLRHLETKPASTETGVEPAP